MQWLHVNIPLSEDARIPKLVRLYLPLLDQMFSELCNLVVNQSDFNCKTGFQRILGIFPEQQIPLGFQFVSNSLFIGGGFLHCRSSLRLVEMLEGTSHEVARGNGLQLWCYGRPPDKRPREPPKV